MPTEISIQASDLNSSSRAFAWPVLEAGNSSYENGVYSVTCEDKERGKSFLLRHIIQGAPLIEKWMTSGQLSFVCSVAAPRSMYRILHVSSSPEQSIEWIRKDLGEYPMFTPMIVAQDKINHIVDSESDGLSTIWDRKELLLLKGARVAVGPTFKFQAGINGMLDFNLDESLGNGRFKVEESSADGFKFKVHLSAGLYEHLRYQRGGLAGANIMVHVVSAAFGILKRDYTEPENENGEGWRSFRNLIGLSDLLEQEGLGHWSDENFKPELAATGLYPHILPVEGGQQ